MSRDPGVCGTCHEEKVRAKHRQPRIDWENTTASTSGSLGVKLKLIKNAVYPYEYDDKSHCANINCSDGRENISDKMYDINRGLGHAAQTGDWTDVDKEDLERLEQLSEHATEVVNVADINWLNTDKTSKWQKIHNEIDDFETNTGKAIERTAEVASTPDASIHGNEKIPECRSTLNNLDGVRHSIHVQEVVVDTVNRIAEQQNEQAVVVEEETAIHGNEADEQQERDEIDQNPDEESTEALKERTTELEAEKETLNEQLADQNETIENLEKENEDLNGKLTDRDERIKDLEAEISELIDDKRELVDKKYNLSKESIELQQELQQLKANNQQQETERGSEPSPSDPSTEAERVSDANTDPPETTNGSGTTRTNRRKHSFRTIAASNGADEPPEDTKISGLRRTDDQEHAADNGAESTEQETERDEHAVDPDDRDEDNDNVPGFGR
jgi:predicted nuclease with TOPRIM domain